MTVMIPEAVGTATAGGAAAAEAGGAGAGAGAARSASGSKGAKGKAGAAGSSGRQGRQGERGRKGDAGKTARRVSRAASSAKGDFSPEFRNYQGVILAEFVAAEILVAATPIAARKNEPGLSPYRARDMTKLLAIGLLYFLLELSTIGSAKWSRFAAWFGALILLTVGLNEAANIAKVLNIFSGPDTAGEGQAGPILGQQPPPVTGQFT